MVSPPHQALSHPKEQCCFGVTLLPGPLPIFLMLGSCIPAAAPQIPKINLEYWQSYEDLEECMEPMKQLSLLLESSTKSKIHSTLDYFLKFMYEKLETSPKRHVATCAVLNTLVDTFRKKLLMLLDDVEQFFLWVVAAMLDVFQATT